VSTPNGVTLQREEESAITVPAGALPTDPFGYLTATTSVTLTDAPPGPGAPVERVFTRQFVRATKTFTDTTPVGRTRVQEVDDQGRVVREQVTGLAETAFAYEDGLLETIRTTGLNAANTLETRTITLGYDPARRLETITDPLLRAVTLGYDAADRVISTTLPGTPARVVGFGYADGAGNLTSVTPPGKPAHAFTYTPLDQEATYTPPLVPGSGTLVTGQTWDLDRALDLVTRPDEESIDLVYEPTSGRLSQIVTPSHTITHAYYGVAETNHALGQSPGELKTVTTDDGVGLTLGYDGSLLTTSRWDIDAGGGVVAGTVLRTYDDDFRLASIQVAGAGPPEPAASFGYDADGLLTQAGALTLGRHPAHGLVETATLSLGPDQDVSDTRTYTGFGELRSYTATADEALVYREDISGRDLLGRITEVTETVGTGTPTTRTYDYDVEGRLWQVNGGAIEYRYDANGNRTQRLDHGIVTETGSYDAQDRLTAYDGRTYTYTANGELETKTAGTDVTRYTYDVLGNLRRVVLHEGPPLNRL